MIPILIIQHIHIIWTKDSRGMPGAAKRNAVPKALQLPATQALQPVIVHEVNAHEFNKFELSEKISQCQQLKKHWCLKFETKHDETASGSNPSVQIRMDYNVQSTGLPSRGAYIRELFELAPSQSAVFQINGRFSWDETWYEQHQINVAFLHKFNERIFLEKTPDFVVNQLEDLF